MSDAARAMTSWRVPRYDPALRSPEGGWRPDDWTGAFHIGRQFGGEKLTRARYLAVEDACCAAVLAPGGSASSPSPSSPPNRPKPEDA